jgi:NADH:ubiquinone oxidoreductase subunit F (NADH-binding)
MASIEGGRGQPRPRPPYPAESGLWGNPTLINNVETYANIAPIIATAALVRRIGTEKSKGTKVFALAGTIANTGLIEVTWARPARHHRGHRRRHPRTARLQGGADRRPLRRLRAGGASGHRRWTTTASRSWAP